MTTYSTSGDVRGSCGHCHRSIETAQRCIDEDQKGCAAQGGYSDRVIVHSDGSSLTQEELEEIDNSYYNY
jgi:D-arabinose 1-dehydrogenase-like Zn-dependent alcohol dehydrogenase